MSKRKKVLGRGLNSLLPDIVGNKKVSTTNISLNEKSGFVELNLSAIISNPQNPRKNFDQESIKKLAETIKSIGLIQPIIVSAKKDFKFMLVAGERRVQAYRLAGFTKIPAIIKKYSDKENAAIGLIENIQRESLDLIEEAEHYKLLIKEYNLKQNDLSEMVGRDRTTISNRMRLLRLPDIIKDKISAGLITEGQVRPLIKLVNHALQIKLVNKIIKEDWSARRVESEIHKLQNPVKVTIKIDPNVKSEQDRLKNILGTKIKIKHNEKIGKGKILIEYYSVDDLERIIKIIEK